MAYSPSLHAVPTGGVMAILSILLMDLQCLYLFRVESLFHGSLQAQTPFD